MRAFITSILIVGLALGGMGLGTFAWFTDSEVVSGNVITTGNVDLGVVMKNANGYVVNNLEIRDIVPGNDNWRTIGYISLTNDGTTPLKWRASFDDYAGNLDMDKVQFRITSGGVSNDYTWGSYNGDWLEYGPETLNTGQTREYRIDAKLDPSADNDYADKFAYLRATFEATQPDGDWAEFDALE